ncbi:hypothetical protein ACOMHN_012627 [Nucella lapillus]
MASPPAIGVTPKVTLRSDVSSDAASQLIDVTDADGDSFTCRTSHTVQTAPFNVLLTAATKGYLLTISHSNPSALTARQYVINVQCTDVNSESATADVTVTISSNSPPTATTSQIAGTQRGEKKLRSIQVVPSRNLHPLMVPPFLQPHPDLQSAVGNAPLSSKHPTHLPTTDCLLSITPLMGGQPSDAPALSPPSPLQQGGQSSNAPALSPPSPLPQGSQPIALALSPSSPPPQDGQPSDAPGLSPSSSTLLLCPSDSTLSICHLNSQSAVKTANDCMIRNVRDLRYLTLTSSEVMDINVTDGKNPAVAFRRVLSFINHNKAPVFTPLPSVIKVHEDVTSSKVLVTFDVTDDQDFSRIFSVNTSASLFDFESSTGVVKLASGQSLDYESGPRSLVLRCVADDGYLQSTGTVTLSVLDVNEAPALRPPAVAVTVPEGPPSSVAVTLPLTVTDVDEAVTTTSHTFSVVAGGTYSQDFTFPDPHKPVLTNLHPLDKDGPLPSSLSIHVAVSDRGGKSATAQVVVTLTDVNDNSPVFEPGSLRMSDVYVGMATGSALGKVKATDADEGTNQIVEFSLVTSSPDPGLFRVQPDGGVSLSKTITQPHGTALTLVVKATDKGSPAKSATTFFTFAWNKPPTFINLPNVAEVPEDPSLEKLLLTLNTSDPENDAVLCSVTDVTPKFAGSAPFVVRPVPGTSDQGVYYTGGKDLSRDVSRSYDVMVKAEDGKGGRGRGLLKVKLTANTPPQSSCVGPDF